MAICELLKNGKIVKSRLDVSMNLLKDEIIALELAYKQCLKAHKDMKFYCQGDLKEDLIKEIFKTYSDWDGKYIVRVFYYDENRKEQFIDSDEFRIIS